MLYRRKLLLRLRYKVDFESVTTKITQRKCINLKPVPLFVPPIIQFRFVFFIFCLACVVISLCHETKQLLILLYVNLRTIALTKKKKFRNIPYSCTTN